MNLKQLEKHKHPIIKSGLNPTKNCNKKDYQKDGERENRGRS